MSEERQPDGPPPEQEPTPQEAPGQQPSPPIETPPPEPQPAAQDRMDWRDRRIGEQQQRLRERNARIAQLEAELAQARGAPPPQPPQFGAGNGTGQPAGPQPAFPQHQGDIQRQINEAAAALAATQEFNRRCNDVAEAGRRVYQNFDQRVQRLIGLVDPNDQQQIGQYNAFLNAAMETGQATRLIYELGGDLNEASRIMAMEPVKMAVELTRISARATTTDQSGAPRPITPAASLAQSNRTLISPDDPDTADGLSTEEWMRRRMEQVSTRRERTLG